MGRIRKNGYKILEKLIPRSNGFCPICGRDIDLQGIKNYVRYMKIKNKKEEGIVSKIKRRRIDVNIDHIKPIEAGGTNDLENMQLVHPICNVKKGIYF